MASHPVPPHPDDEQRLARAVLTTITAPGDPDVHRLITDHGAIDTYLRLGSRGRHRLTTTSWHDSGRAHRVRTLLHTPGIRLLIPGDPDWPTTLDRLATPEAATLLGPTHAPPVALWVRGTASLSALLSRALTVTGARAATSYGTHLATTITAGCAERGYTVVAGTGFGIDAAAHRGAQSTGRPSIAVLAGGPDRPHPAAHTDLCDRIAENGLLLSEQPPGANATRTSYSATHRLLGALSAGTVLVEAGPRSGGIRTVHAAIGTGSAAMAVPGPVTSALSAGCHLLLRDARVHLVTDIADVLTVLHGRQP
ncbi:DNA-processing protein DprA [Actinoplanes sp. DH11]|uniref:DNA-processing protein DprA n=1 Tax=Actinoplanes sp. DH11 TaxID=2857011 RepID=UPI001E435ED6|nr:DNA-processing protein DprA [Actinoplanes sp. DH11]